MKRLTKSDCEVAAKALADKAFNSKIEKLEKDKRVFGDSLIDAYIPKPLMACYEEYKELFSETEECKIVVRSETADSYSASVYVDSEKKNPLGIYKLFFVTEKEYAIAMEFRKNIQNLKHDKEVYQYEVKEALYQLRTKKRIEEQFPESLPYLDFDDEKKNLPIPQYTKLRSMLK